MLSISDYAAKFESFFPSEANSVPWEVVANLDQILRSKILSLPDDYVINGSIAIHRSATIEEHCILKGPIIISENCFVGAHAYLRGGVFLGAGCVAGPGSEIKSSILMSGTAVAHFNFIGDSILGSKVNLEAGAIIANHFNERVDKTICVMIEGTRHFINSHKFGALLGDGTRIGANAVLSPGTVLKPNSIVKRLELIDQCAP
jgi:NDP-sugar pyrophosphorylase family protein